MSDMTPVIAGVNHISVPVRDRAEAVRFWTSLVSAELIDVYEDGAFALIRMPGGFNLGLSQQSGGWTARAAEFPHYAFNVRPEMFDVLKNRLGDLGVPTDLVWTRFSKEALLYFRDPSGNLFELYCREGYKGAASAAVSVGYGGNFKTDFEALNYAKWNDPGT